MATTFAVIGAVAFVALIVGLSFWGKSRPYPFTHDGRKYFRLKDGSFTDAARKPVTDPVLISALEASYLKEKASDDAKVGEWGNLPDAAD